MSADVDLYKKAFPVRGAGEEPLPSGLVDYVLRIWPADNHLKVLCFGYGNGLTEAVLLSAIKKVLSQHPEKDATVLLIDTRSTIDLYGAGGQETRSIIENDRLKYEWRWWEDVEGKIDSTDESDLSEYDIVTAYFSLHFIPEWPQVFRWLARQVRPTGCLGLAVERGYRAWIDGATRIKKVDECECRNAWRRYHDARLGLGDGWLPDISASDIEVLSLISAGDFSPVKFGNEESIEIDYPDNCLTQEDIKKIVQDRSVFFPLKNSTPLRWNGLVLWESQCGKSTHNEKAALFFLQRNSSGSLWSDESGYIKRVALALLSHAIKSQQRVVIPHLTKGLDDKEYLEQIRRCLRNFLALVGTHFMRHCGQAAGEWVFVKYEKLADLFSSHDSTRLYLPNVPILTFGKQKWRQQHDKAYTNWRAYLERRDKDEKRGGSDNNKAWIGRYVLELFPWVGAWEIQFGGKETSVSIKRHRYSPHFEGEKSSWSSGAHVDVLQIVLGCEHEHNHVSASGNGMSDDHALPEFEWHDNWTNVDDNPLDTYDPSDGKASKIKESLENLLMGEGYGNGNGLPTRLQDLAELLDALAYVNKQNGHPWHRVYYLAVPQIAQSFQNESVGTDIDERSGMGFVLYAGKETHYAPDFAGAMMQLLPSALRMSQLQFHYLYLHENQLISLPNDYYGNLSFARVDQIYAAVFAPGASGDPSRPMPIDREIVKVQPTEHEPPFIASVSANIAVIMELGITEINVYLDKVASEQDAQKLKAKLGRHKGSFVPADLCTKLCDEIGKGNFASNTFHLDAIPNDAWKNKSANEKALAFWAISGAAVNYASCFFKNNRSSSDAISFLQGGAASVICISWAASTVEAARYFVSVAAATARKELPSGDEQMALKGIFNLRETLGCNRGLGIYESYTGCNHTREIYLQHGESIQGPGGIAIWLSTYDTNWIDLVIWLRHKSPSS